MEKSSSDQVRNDNILKHENNSIKCSTDPYCPWGMSNKSNTSTTTDQDSFGDLVGGFSWPPRSYTCTFCKREFRSAQALGGHMNVHRRDRARLRQIPSSQTLISSNYTLFNLNLHPNPNPNPNPNSSPYSGFSSPLISSSPSSIPTTGANLAMMKSQIPAFGVCKFDGLSSENNERSEIVRLKLEIGLLGESRADDLDLELRLSCS